MNLYVDDEINNNVPVYYYTNNYQPLLSKSYRIEVSHPNFKDLGHDVLNKYITLKRFIYQFGNLKLNYVLTKFSFN